ncbi:MULTISPECIES: hypothetical protein [Sorangium]|uniref:Secreted protein n=1 Tax=Sorangium cellulosum TaxID=56 RepID=A0A4P2R8V2_SORCE|nr:MULTISPECIES: hypothetical protein [Sorangium]AUX38603.1 hypothetical protein SOCE836_108500 [Sorangium cellulosum]WCQ97888.1 hypothetical protein NQZ70_10686 [Sorangium sp. Soce836]
MPRPRRSARRSAPALAACAALLGWPLAAGAAPEGPRQAAAAAATEPDIRLTLPWLLVQLVPSPELWIGSGEAHFGVRWQVTPLLYSFGMNRKLSPWRAFVVEPLTRHSGSLELFGSPEYIARPGALGERWILRGGVRAYFPLLHRGDYLSCSLGGSAIYARERLGAAYEAGVYTLFGALGAQVTTTPTAALRSTTITLSIRYF